MTRYLENLNECTDPVAGDMLQIYDASAGSTDKDRRVDVAKFGLITTGAWTPSVTCGTSGTITVNSSYDTANYIKIGNLVYCSGQLVIASVSAPVGALLLGNLPFAVASPSEGRMAFSGQIYNYGPTQDIMIARMAVGDDRPNILYWTGSTWGAAAGRIAANSGLVFSFTYMTT